MFTKFHRVRRYKIAVSFYATDSGILDNSIFPVDVVSLVVIQIRIRRLLGFMLGHMNAERITRKKSFAASGANVFSIIRVVRFL